MSSRGVNKVILIGRVGQSPDVRIMTPNGESVTNWSMATSEVWTDKRSGDKREQTEWHRCVAYRRLAEVIGQYVKKGSKIYVEGRLQTRKWKDKSGVERYTTEVIVSEMQMLDSRSDGTGNDDQEPKPKPQAKKQRAKNAQSTSAMDYQAQSDGNVPPNYGNAPDSGFDDDMPF